VELREYRKLRNALQCNVSPGGQGVLTAIADRLRAGLAVTGLFEDVEVEVTGHTDRLVIAMCSFTEDHDEADVARALETLWRRELRYDFWEAHSTLVSRGQVELQGATRASSYGHYVTVHMVAQKVRVPAQRAAADEAVTFADA
jgi:hypothetical protein